MSGALGRLSRGTVVVGVDGSSGSRSALRFAADEAGRRQLRVTAVMADTLDLRGLRHLEQTDDMSLLATILTGPATSVAEQVGPPVLRPAPEVRLERTIVEELGREPAVPVVAQSWDGSPGRVLVELSTDAAMVVVGARGRGGLRGMRLGSVAQEVVHRARCPVSVVRRAWHATAAGPGARVVVGLDMAGGISGPAEELLRFAAEEARLRADTLGVVAVREPLRPGWGAARRNGGAGPAAPGGQADTELVDALGEVVAAVADTAGLRVEVEVRHGSVVEELTEAGHHAALLVIGAGPDLRGGLEPGSVRHQVVHYTSCPVTVFRAAPPGPAHPTDPTDRSTAAP